ncbi:hypothetical protein CB0940_10116 [Cercospora beticola]|uniref:N-acetylgalactosaminide beta-1,3-galactosyltransferase n=2 Tax=Cercospora beticola TaxID=122368 RepID=A0A2G5HU75_CERBT|nr:hypothetical protein CB0940_10116 [Cercospora beticola]PIA96097.1 hypothetical protein CB0940_10116 [Cercospora beticola]CAK1366732.1 unnamed protein product [Cercospora beticola]
MEKVSTMPVFSRRIPFSSLSRGYILLLTTFFAIFLFSGTWYARTRTSAFDTYRNDYLNLSGSEATEEQQKVEELLYDHSLGPQSPSSETTDLDDAIWDDCRQLPGADRILLIIKTGATEIYKRFPMHIETTLTCVPNYLILSDLDQTIGANITVHDALKLVTPQTRTHHPDFQLYHSIQNYHATGQDIQTLSSPAGWNLDKWKFLPMIHKAWDISKTEHNSTIDWFVMIEADTALSWLNLIHFLLPLDPSEPQYIGSPAALVADGSSFAHGGSGVIMSRKAIEKVEHMRENFLEGEVDGPSSEEAYDQKWEDHTSEICCGDAVLSHAFAAVGVNVASARPEIQGDTRLSLPFDTVSGGKEYLRRLEEKLKSDILHTGGIEFQEVGDDLWCKRPITFHHVKPVEVDEFWRFQEEYVERENGGLWNESFTYRDVFMEFVWPRVTDPKNDGVKEEDLQIGTRVARNDWDNMSEWWKIELKDQSEGGGVSVVGAPVPRLENDTDQEALEYFTAQSVFSAQNCQWACERRGEPFAWPNDPYLGECVQWRWSSQGKCHLDRRIRLGEAKTKEDQHDDEGKEEKWTSGWVEKRVREFVKRRGDCHGPIEQMKERLEAMQSGRAEQESSMEEKKAEHGEEISSETES